MFRIDGSEGEYCFMKGGPNPKPVTKCDIEVSTSTESTSSNPERKQRAAQRFNPSRTGGKK
jgi:hypothetical protein